MMQTLLESDDKARLAVVKGTFGLERAKQLIDRRALVSREERTTE
jgi:hypothetical protein